ncbi:hypothetical protein [Rhizobium leguminosarum]|uniref:hypothetical protein n=1 Tax=Rhizobium leguminosarum TaxID=384 RepID=UPI003D7C1F00
MSRSGLIPHRYSIAQNKVRGVAPSGHISPELDIVLYDRDDSVLLRKRSYLEDPINSHLFSIQKD